MVCVCSERERGKERAREKLRQTETHFRLAHMIVGAGKSNPIGKVDQQAENSEKTDVSALVQRQSEAEFPPPQETSVSQHLKPSTDWVRFTHMMEGNLLY